MEIDEWLLGLLGVMRRLNFNQILGAAVAQGQIGSMDEYRKVDRSLQRLRRAKKIKFKHGFGWALDNH